MHAPTVTLTRVLVGLLQNSKSGIPILPIVDDILHKSLLRLGWTQNPKKLNSSRSPRTRLLQALFGRRPLARFNAPRRHSWPVRLPGCCKMKTRWCVEAQWFCNAAAAPEDKTLRLANLLRDSVKSVRIAAAKELIGAPIQQLPKQFKTELQKASQEFKESIVAKLDFPETHLIVGGTSLSSRNWRAAEAAFMEAVRLDPQQQDAWSMVVRIQEALGQRERAKQTILRALELNPDSSLLQQLQLSLRLNN